MWAGSIVSRHKIAEGPAKVEKYGIPNTFKIARIYHEDGIRVINALDATFPISSTPSL